MEVKDSLKKENSIFKTFLYAFKNKELELALDEYLKCCCGLDFGKD